MSQYISVRYDGHYETHPVDCSWKDALRDILLDSLNANGTTFRKIKSGEAVVFITSDKYNEPYEYRAKPVAEEFMDSFVNNNTEFNSILRDDLLNGVDNDLLYFTFVGYANEDLEQYSVVQLHWSGRKGQLAHCRVSEDDLALLKLTFGDALQNITTIGDMRKFLDWY